MTIYPKTSNRSGKTAGKNDVDDYRQVDFSITMILCTQAETLSMNSVKLLQTLSIRPQERSTKLLNRKSTKLSDLAGQKLDELHQKLSGELSEKCSQNTVQAAWKSRQETISENKKQTVQIIFIF